MTTRTDLFSVMAWDAFTGAYVHEHMTRSKSSAINAKWRIKHNQRAMGQPGLIKVVHPKDQDVCLFIALGNEITD